MRVTCLLVRLHVEKCGGARVRLELGWLSRHELILLREVLELNLLLTRHIPIDSILFLLSLQLREVDLR